ncbi:NAD-P-binding protein [Trametes polyzona]|nr:NAD-P-binding protein [Trametes polyzona]
MSFTPLVWFVTGSSSGFGLETVNQALAGGDNVIATSRDPSASEALTSLTSTYTPSRLLLLPLDVTSQASVDAAFERAKAAFGRVDVVFNNAGYVALGEAEGVPLDTVARPLFDVNFWGAVRVSLRAVRFFRDENWSPGGLLLQNSATVGVVGLPAVAFYAASKHALEGFSESLAKELDPAWNTKVCIVEPGAFKTSVLTKNMIVLPPHPAYTANPALPVSLIRNAFLKGGDKETETVTPVEADLHPGDVTKAVAKIIALARLPNPPLHFPLGKDAIGFIREKIKKFEEEIHEYGSWSDDLGVWASGQLVAP